jgi:hypothetical protein
MNLYLHFILLNSDFNQGIADDFYDGQESEDNIKHLWEDELLVNEPVVDFKIKHNEPYVLNGLFANDKPFSFEIPNVTTINCTLKSGIVSQFAVSKKLLKKTEKTVDEKKNETHLYFYMRDDQPFQNPIDGVYIVNADFPNELKKQDINE